MQADTLKLIFTYTIALITVVGGGFLLYLTKDDPTSPLALAIAAMMGSALSFVFSSESATRATRAAQRSAAGGAVTATANPPITIEQIDPPEGSG